MKSSPSSMHAPYELKAKVRSRWLFFNFGIRKSLVESFINLVLLDVSGFFNNLVSVDCTNLFLFEENLLQFYYSNCAD